MALLPGIAGNLALGLASYKRPGLLQQAQQTLMQNAALQQQAQQQAYDLQRQAEEDRRRREMEDWKFQQAKHQAQAQMGLAGILGAPNLPGSATYGMSPEQKLQEAMPFLAQVDPGAALGLLAPTPEKQTTLMQNLAAAGLRPGTPEYESAMLTALMKPQVSVDMGTKFGSVPGGAVREETAAGETRIRFLPGSKEYEDRIEGYQGLENAADRLKQMSSLINEYGTELMPGATKGTMANLYGAILADVAKARNLGVLQPGELQFIQAQIANPAQMESLLIGKEGMMAQYKRQLTEVNSIMEKAKERLSQQGIKVNKSRPPLSSFER